MLYIIVAIYRHIFLIVYFYIFTCIEATYRYTIDSYTLNCRPLRLICRTLSRPLHTALLNGLETVRLATIFVTARSLNQNTDEPLLPSTPHPPPPARSFACPF